MVSSRWSRRGTVLVVLAGIVTVLLVAAAGLVVRGWSRASDPPPDCRASQEAEEARVHTGRQFTDVDLPGVGAYQSISWQARTMGVACSRAPGPTDREYQGLIRLAAADTAALAARYPWQPASAGPGAELPVWPGLAPQVPAGVRWRHSPEYDESVSTTREIRLRFAVEVGLVLFTVRER